MFDYITFPIITHNGDVYTRNKFVYSLISSQQDILGFLSLYIETRVSGCKRGIATGLKLNFSQQELSKFSLRSARHCFVLCLKTEAKLPLRLAPQTNTCDHSVQKFRCIYLSLCTKAQNASFSYSFVSGGIRLQNSPNVLQFNCVKPK